MVVGVKSKVRLIHFQLLMSLAMWSCLPCFALKASQNSTFCTQYTTQLEKEDIYIEYIYTYLYDWRKTVLHDQFLLSTDGKHNNVIVWWYCLFNNICCDDNRCTIKNICLHTWLNTNKGAWKTFHMCSVCWTELALLSFHLRFHFIPRSSDPTGKSPKQ